MLTESLRELRHELRSNTDPESQRAVLLRQLDDAGRRWSTDNTRTIIIVDGLDHIAREQHPQRSLVEDLFGPAEIPDGVFVILGTQTTTIFPQTIIRALKADGRTVTMSPLSSSEIADLVTQSGVGEWLQARQRVQLIEATEGHPLATAYLLEDLKALANRELDKAVRTEAAGRLLVDGAAYGASVSERYDGYYQSIENDPELTRLVGIVSRLREAVDLDWIATWAPDDAFRRFEALTEPFCRREGSRWWFIHNSFRLYLVARTANSPNIQDQALHTELADLCATAGERWPDYRAEEVAHRFLAGDDTSVLRLASPDALRAQLEQLQPAAKVRQRLFIGLRAAARAEDTLATMRLLLFNNELWQRNYTLSSDRLALHLAKIDSDGVVAHVVSGHALDLDVSAALEIAVKRLANGRVQDSALILSAVGRLAGVLERSKLANSGDLVDTVANWAELSHTLSGLQSTLDELEAHLPQHEATTRSRTEDRREASDRQARIDARHAALARCTDVARSQTDIDELENLQALIDEGGSNFWTARCRLVRAIVASESDSIVQLLDHLHAIADIGGRTSESDDAGEDADESLPSWLLLQSAELLVRLGLGHSNLVETFRKSAGPQTWPQPVEADKGLEPYETWLVARRIDCLLGGALTEAPHGTVSPAELRLQQALDDLATLEARGLQSAADADAKHIRATGVDRIIRVLEIGDPTLRTDHRSYVFTSAAKDLWRRTFKAISETDGPAGVSALLAKFRTAWDDVDRSKHWPARRRLSILGSVVAWGDAQLVREMHPTINEMATLIDMDATDAHDRVDLLLEISTTWAAAGALSESTEITRRAVRAAFSAGTHDDDRQLIVALEWAIEAYDRGAMPVESFVEFALEFVDRLAAIRDGGHVEREAAELLIRTMWRVSPHRAVAAADDLASHGVIGEITGLEAVVSAAAADTTISLELVGHIAADLLIPVAESTLQELREALTLRWDEAGGRATIDRFNHAVRTWSLDSQILTESVHNVVDDSVSDNAETPGVLLTRLRRLKSQSDALPKPEVFRRAAHQRRTLQTAQQLLAEAERLQLDLECHCYCAAMIADEGDTDSGTDIVRRAIATVSPRDWSPHWEGGRRRSLMAAACTTGNQAMRALAWSDLATCMASEAMTGPIYPSEFLQLLLIFADPSVLYELLSDVRSSLDHYAPASGDRPVGTPVITIHPESVLCATLMRYFGHPARDLDFGARRSMTAALLLKATDSQNHLVTAIRSGGWKAEAALNSALSASADAVFEPTANLIAVLFETALCDDAILRDLAGMTLRNFDAEAPVPPPRELPPSYRLETPSVPDRRPPELDRGGVPFIDRSDPQQVVAPFDISIRIVARIGGLDEDTVLHRAASLQTQCADDWTVGGHREFASRVHRRKQALVYRPWAFMIGRRALGIVLADVADAGLGEGPDGPARTLGLIDTRLFNLNPKPLDESTPPPFRPATASDYSASEWLDETEHAADAAAAAVAAAPAFVLAERSRWRPQMDDFPRERRTLTEAVNLGLPVSFRCRSESLAC